MGIIWYIPDYGQCRIYIINRSIYFGLKISPHIGTLWPKHILFGYMDPGTWTLRGQRDLKQEPWQEQEQEPHKSRSRSRSRSKSKRERKRERERERERKAK